jgi:hypothetical protein
MSPVFCLNKQKNPPGAIIGFFLDEGYGGQRKSYSGFFPFRWLVSGLRLSG